MSSETRLLPLFGLSQLRPLWTFAIEGFGNRIRLLLSYFIQADLSHAV